MRNQLIQYVDLLFAGVKDSGDIKQEILQNTLDRYDDLISEGKVPEAAYRLAITGIGDLSEILGTDPAQAAPAPAAAEPQQDTPEKKRNRAIAIGLYIVAAIPLILLDTVGMDILGLSITLIIVAAATILLIINGAPDKDEEKRPATSNSQRELRKSIHTVINVITFVAYFLLSFKTGSWHITWLLFPISGALWQLAKAILDLKEAQ